MDLTVYCFAFVAMSVKGAIELAPYASRQLAQCDGSNLFTNGPTNVHESWRPFESKSASIGDGSTIWVTNETVPRGQNMIGLFRVWEVLLGRDPGIETATHNELLNASTIFDSRSPVAAYDWVVKSEVDHYLRASSLRHALEMYQMKISCMAAPVLMRWQNVIIANRMLLVEIQEQTSTTNFPYRCPSVGECTGCKCAQVNGVLLV